MTDDAPDVPPPQVRTALYERAVADLVSRRRAGTLSDDDEDALLERIDELWWAMTDEERCMVDTRPLPTDRRPPPDDAA